MTDPVRDVWEHGLLLLSLDLSRVVFGKLGIRTRHEETLRGFCRDALLGRFATPTASWFTSETRTDGWDPQLEQALQFLQHGFGLGLRDELEHWARYVACFEADANPWVVYNEYTSVWGSLVRQGKVATPPAGSWARALVEQTHMLDLKASVRLAIHREYSNGVSAWDRRVLVTRGLDDLPAGSDFVPFEDDLVLTATLARFQQAWRRLLSLASAAELASFGEAVAERFSAAGLPYTVPEALP